MAATIYGSQYGNYSYSGTSIVVTVPAALNGHTQTVILSIRDDYDTATITPPSGWTLRGQLDPGEGSVGEEHPRAVFYTRKVSQDTAEGTQTWTLSAAKEFAWGSYVVTEDYNTHTETEVAGASASWVAPTVTVPTVNGTDALHVSVVLPAWYSRSVSSAPSGYTAMTGLNNAANAASYTCVIVGYKSVGTGATGTTTWTVSESAKYCAFSIAYVPAASPSAVSISGGGELPSTYSTTEISASPTSITGNPTGNPDTITVTDQNSVPVFGVLASSSNTAVVTVGSQTDANGQVVATRVGVGSATITLIWTAPGGSIPLSDTVSVTLGGIVPASAQLSLTSAAPTVTINAIGTAPTITTTTLPTAVQNTAYNAVLSATGTGPFTWSRVSGTLPTGMTVLSSGAVAGTTTQTGTFSSIVVRATDPNGLYDDQTLSLTVVAAGDVPVITSTSLPTGTQGIAYSYTVTATGSTPRVWTASNLPNGLNIASGTGAITGTPTVFGVFEVTITATHATAGSDTERFTLVINSPAATFVESPWARFSNA